ncbi:MAG TPA: TylF/MycF/NovP-related O-methyltransferase [Anaerolineales bacterium]|nr:TylF/MycF/NovP-related O-methyltransferase [Anaerolineales bacterium]
MEEQQRWDLYNQFSLWGDVERYTKMLARYELFKLIADKPGDIVEGGVLKGAGLLYWAKLVEIFNPQSRRKVIGFDTFEGYPEDSGKGHDRKTAKNFKQIQIKNNRDVAMQTIMETAKQQGLEYRIELVKGKAEESIPAYIEANPGFRAALIDLDFVLYEPTLAALEYLYPCVVSGGVVALDEYAVAGAGETEAVDEFLAGKHVKLLAFPWAKSPTAYFMKEGTRG